MICLWDHWFFSSLVQSSVEDFYWIFQFSHCFLQLRNLWGLFIFFISLLKLILYCFLDFIKLFSVFSYSSLSIFRTIILITSQGINVSLFLCGQLLEVYCSFGGAMCPWLFMIFICNLHRYLHNWWSPLLDFMDWLWQGKIFTCG